MKKLFKILDTIEDCNAYFIVIKEQEQLRIEIYDKKTSADDKSNYMDMNVVIDDKASVMFYRDMEWKTNCLENLINLHRRYKMGKKLKDTLAENEVLEEYNGYDVVLTFTGIKKRFLMPEEQEEIITQTFEGIYGGALTPNIKWNAYIKA